MYVVVGTAASYEKQRERKRLLNRRIRKEWERASGLEIIGFSEIHAMQSLAVAKSHGKNKSAHQLTNLIRWLVSLARKNRSQRSGEKRKSTALFPPKLSGSLLRVHRAVPWPPERPLAGAEERNPKASESQAAASRAFVRAKSSADLAAKDRYNYQPTQRARVRLAAAKSLEVGGLSALARARFVYRADASFSKIKNSREAAMNQPRGTKRRELLQRIFEKKDRPRQPRRKRGQFK